MKIAGVYPQPVSRGPQGEIEFFEPLGLEYVLAQVADRHEVRLFTLFGRTQEQVTQDILEYNPDILALSAMTPQINLGLRMAGEVKRRNPRVRTIFGGYHPTAIPETINRPEVDLLIAGEGEEKFIFAIDNFQALMRRRGFAYKDGEGNHVVHGLERIQDLDSLKDPLRPDFLEQLRDHGHRYPPVLTQTGMASVLFSRGCLFNCDFCASPTMYGQQIKYRSIPRVVAELRELKQRRGINSFLFTDLNFTANPDKTADLCKAIRDSGIGVYWECLSNIATADNPQLLEVMYTAGCRKIGWGIESLDPRIVKVMDKRGLDRTQRVLEASEAAGMVNTGFYIIGHPLETRESILEGATGLSNLPIHRLRVTVYTPLPGSRAYESTQPKNPDFDLYDTTHLVFNHPNLFQGDLDNLREELTRRFYASEAHRQRIKRFVDRFPEYREVFA